ncbi:hypothetical protein [uncultured Phascolarctobacterium sp.]|uniref:rolling circle replication-associated protein n=1 Tax=uncultured Phascolarctobacterium sp. TaxID=512296 RepID=UPI00261B8BB4|nr:hypothetical protein [uncultured Phascolarctobacterium sp.]
MAIRERGIKTITYYCGDDEREISLFAFTEPVRIGKRSKKKNESAPKQKNLNDKNARAYFRRLCKTNFVKGDYHLTLTYDKDNLPETIERAEQLVKNYLRRVARFRANNNLLPAKYIYVTEQSSTGRIHHHLLISGDMDRQQLEDMWKLGYSNADKLRPNKKGLANIIAYLSKDPKGRKRWHPSRNLKKPEYTVSYTKTSMLKYEQLSLWPEDSEATKEYCEKQNKGFELTEFVKQYNEITGTWYMYAMMRRKETDETLGLPTAKRKNKNSSLDYPPKRI